MMPERPAPAVSFAEGAEIRPLTDGDQDFARYVYSLRENAVVAGSLDVYNPQFVPAIRAAPWSMAMVLRQDGEAVGLAALTSVDVHSRNGRLVVLARDPRLCRTAMGLYLRHAFWSHPLHRLYAVLPARVPLPGSYADLLLGCGFVDEGVLRSHLSYKGGLRSLSVFGLLRREFDAWCAESQPALLLS